jgi:phage-related holin
MKHYLQVLDFSNLINAKTGLIGIMGAMVGTYLGRIYGSDVNLAVIGALAFAIVLDWFGAIAAATKDKSYSSQYGIIGVLRTAVILALPVFGRLLDSALSSHGFFFYMLTFGLLYHTAVSMTANFTRAGWDKWIPVWALNLITSEIEAKMKRAQTRKGEDSNGNQTNADTGKQ